MRAEIVSIGTELLLGTITDTNAPYLAQRLAALGIDCFYVSHVGDNLKRIVETLQRGWERSDLIVTTGGLGPTGDDLTREAISELLGETMKVDSALEAELRVFFLRRGVAMPTTNLKQATLIPSAQSLLNPVGTAPGWWVYREDTDGPKAIVSMPGVPFEMKQMWEHEVEPRLRSLSSTIIVSRTLKVLGMGESAVEEKVRDLMNGSNPTLAPYAKQDGIHLRITAKARDAESAQPLIVRLEDAVRSRLGEAIYGRDEDTPQGVTVGLLEKLGYTCLLLEVGHDVAGALASLVGARQNAGAVWGLISVVELSDLVTLYGAESDEGDPLDLERVLSKLKDLAGTDVALAVLADTQTKPPGNILSVDAEIVLLTPDEDGKVRSTRLRQSWTTGESEVKRLVGLSATNLLRLRLLKNSKIIKE